MSNGFSVICDRPDMVIIPTSKLIALEKAQMGIDLIGSTLGRFGADDHVVNAVCKQFGYEYKEPTATECCNCKEPSNAE